MGLLSVRLADQLAENARDYRLRKATYRTARVLFTLFGLQQRVDQEPGPRAMASVWAGNYKT